MRDTKSFFFPIRGLFVANTKIFKHIIAKFIVPQKNAEKLVGG